WITGSAAQFYADAIRASMDQWGIATAAIDAYLAQPGVVYAGGAQGMKQIAYEKWVALFNQETEAYAEYRRLDFPVLVPGPDAATTTVPTRLPYPDIEQSLNAENLAAAKSAQGDTDITGHVWWDK
ncbi:MAG TPA: SusD/RagB family nutrient-binding outer membrane lipoprotein, partial [Gemmatimonadaceae bacterium]|nr:SusD/RagB family nutrient-binding outer membrane lipoprotein [Gemmatimonadaceae bacterium]